MRPAGRLKYASLGVQVHRPRGTGTHSLGAHDDVKNLLDLEKSRDVECRSRDGHIPKLTPRIFSTNWPWELFWPRHAWSPMHATAINRLHLWVDVKSDLRAPGSAVTAEGYIFL